MAFIRCGAGADNTNLFPTEIESGEYYTLGDPTTASSLPYNGGPNNQHNAIVNVQNITELTVTGASWTIAYGVKLDGTSTKLVEGNVTTPFDVTAYDFFTVISVSGGSFSMSITDTSA